MLFETIDYLIEGTPRQREAYTTLTKHAVLAKLEPFTPILVGTIPINIDIESSDLDIICYWADKQAFYSAVQISFGNEKAFSIRESSALGRDAIVANFWVDNFEVEVFGQNMSTTQQMGYRHMLIEHKLLIERGEAFRQQIIALKKQGYKTEPAFGKLLGLGADPYTELLAYE
ncbi:DUF4269 domain-containing protein [Spirosoma harenae]